MGLPTNKDAEDCTLGAVLLDPPAIDDIEFLEVDDFYSEKNRHVLTAMREIQASGGIIEYVSVVDVLRRKGLLEEVDLAYLLGLMEGTPYASAIVQYATIVKQNSEKRKLLQLANQLRSDITTQDKSVDELVSDVEQGLSRFGLSRVKPGPRNYAEEALEILNDDEERTSYISTGLPALDRIIGGIAGFVIIGGRPSMGKSALVRDILRAQANRRKRVALFSQDQSGTAIYRFEASLRSGVPWDSIKNGSASQREKERWRSAVEELRSFKEVFAVDDYPYNINQLTSRIREAVRWGATMIGVDYLQLVSVPGGKAAEFQANAQHVSKALKHLVQELRVPIIALSQLNRAVELRSNKRPMLADLRETGQIEQDAETVMFVFRQSYYERQESGGAEDVETIAEVIVAKQKDGPTGTARLKFDTHFATFKHLT